MIKKSYLARISAICDIGDVRKTNQDRIVVLERMINETNVTMLAVADGCGGLSHGDVISQLIADNLKRFFDEVFPEAMMKPAEEILLLLNEWLEKVNDTARSYGNQIGEAVGSTLALLLLIDCNYYIVSAGDSRVYRLRSGRVEQLTEDQSKVSDMLRNHEITPEQAKKYSGKNVLTMCIGYYQQLRLFTTSGKMKKGDVFLLCSDGFYGVMEDKLSNVIPKRVEYRSAQVLRESIPEGKARDNVSIILAQVVPILIGV